MLSIYDYYIHAICCGLEFISAVQKQRVSKTLVGIEFFLY